MLGAIKLIQSFLNIKTIPRNAVLKKNFVMSRVIVHKRYFFLKHVFVKRDLRLREIKSI